MQPYSYNTGASHMCVMCDVWVCVKVFNFELITKDGWRAYMRISINVDSSFFWFSLWMLQTCTRMHIYKLFPVNAFIHKSNVKADENSQFTLRKMASECKIWFVQNKRKACLVRSACVATIIAKTIRSNRPGRWFKLNYRHGATISKHHHLLNGKMSKCKFK